MPSTRLIGIVLAALLGAQVTLADALSDAQFEQAILPPVPTRPALGLLSFGDREFLYRKLVLDLQNFGDTGGRITPLRDYHMPDVVAWLRALDSLNSRADHHVVLAARYFGQTQDLSQVRYLVQYIQGHVALDPERKLGWMSEAIYLAQARAKDSKLAMEVADQLATYDFPKMTVLAYQLPALVHRNLGNHARAVAYMDRALRLTAHKASATESQFMREFIATYSGGHPVDRPR